MTDPIEAIAQHIRNALQEIQDTWNDEVKQLHALLLEVTSSGVEFDDPRVGYVTVQIDRETWNGLKRLKEGAGG